MVYAQRVHSPVPFSMLKAKFGNALRSKTEKAQVNELQCKVIAHNICCLIQSMYELGIKVNLCARLEARTKYVQRDEVHHRLGAISVWRFLRSSTRHNNTHHFA